MGPVISIRTGLGTDQTCLNSHRNLAASSQNRRNASVLGRAKHIFILRPRSGPNRGRGIYLGLSNGWSDRNGPVPRALVGTFLKFSPPRTGQTIDHTRSMVLHPPCRNSNRMQTWQTPDGSAWSEKDAYQNELARPCFNRFSALRTFLLAHLFSPGYNLDHKTPKNFETPTSLTQI